MQNVLKHTRIVIDISIGRSATDGLFGGPFWSPEGPSLTTRIGTCVSSTGYFDETLLRKLGPCGGLPPKGSPGSTAD
ncbi:hypothetical protein I7I53_05999 [Histoplasma capsulatum var. duboisii H88]|uniref:Uncharacterized protein n=1 Tax=Ajellomyces capsulatus (strain H88) TaxID=544711 RepID=A0A8A1LAZ4_AJEC8|nr:hypothetical protein I7I53_05999 [Histoplasma capsulatum var. duboisii H88]